MSNIIRVSESSPNSEWLVMSNQGTDCFLELLLSAADNLEITEHQKELISFLDDQRSVNNVSPGTAGFDIVDMPWDEKCLIEDIEYLNQVVEVAQTEAVITRLPYEINNEIVLPWLEQFGSMVEQMKQGRD